MPRDLASRSIGSGAEQSGESRRQVRDALGAGEAKDRHELGAGSLGMVLRQVGEGSAGRRAGATRGASGSGASGSGSLGVRPI